MIVLLGAGLRLWQLGSVPPSPDWDEVALGYNAYSILQTGHDEFGNFLPAVLRSFDDYKPAVYAYLTIPSVALFGLTTFAVRFPSAVMGILAIVGMFFLARELFGNRGMKLIDTKHSTAIALVAAGMMAISPWHIQFSHAGFETNVGLTFNIFVALFFLKGLQRPWLLLVAAAFAGINLSVYQSERVFTPLFVLALVIIYRKELFALPKKYLIASILVGVLVVIPPIQFLVANPSALQRVQATSLVSQPTPLLAATALRLKDDNERNDLIGKVVDNRRVLYAKSIVSGYLSHFDLNWLFVTGENNNRHHAPGMGLLYLFSLPFLLIGVYQMVFGKFEKKTKYLIFSWLLIAPIPASVTFDVPHAVRTMNILPMFLLFAAVGLVAAYYSLSRNKWLQIGGVSLVLFFASFNFAYFLNQYYVQQNYFHAYDWQYGYAQAIPELEELKGEYKKIIVSNSAPMDKSYMFFLFYLQYPPQQYQNIISHAPSKVSDIHYFDHYELRKIHWVDEKDTNGVLYVGPKKDFPSDIVFRKVIPYPDGTPAILFVDPKDNKKIIYE